MSVMSHSELVEVVVVDALSFGLLFLLVTIVLLLVETMACPLTGRLYSDTAIARLVKREARRRAARDRAAVLPMGPTPSRETGTTRPPLLFTPAQQALYQDMRAKGWSELATQQACERLPS